MPPCHEWIRDLFFVRPRYEGGSCLSRRLSPLKKSDSSLDLLSEVSRVLSCSRQHDDGYLSTYNTITDFLFEDTPNLERRFGHERERQERDRGNLARIQPPDQTFKLRSSCQQDHDDSRHDGCCVSSGRYYGCDALRANVSEQTGTPHPAVSTGRGDRYPGAHHRPEVCRSARPALCA